MDSKPLTSSSPTTATTTATTTPDATTTSTAAAQAAIQAMMVQITTEGVPKLHCPVCNKALISLNGYVKHLKKHEPPGGFFCRYCEARFCSEDELKRHREAEHTTITCRICKDQQLTFLNEDEYREHIRSVHNGIDREIFKCEKCGAEYKTPEPFKRHQANQCGTIKPHKCDECEMAFYTKYNLKQHKITHSGERRYCCSYCGKNFLQKGRLVEHERSHTGEKPYKCDVCGKCFAHRESIVTHSSIHTGIRLVECPCCLSRFSCYSNLIKHRRSRLDTCGQPEYDPPKNRVRTRRPRIPPTMNPTSEIKVCNMNKIIKPSHKINEKKGRLSNKSIIDESTVEVVKPPIKRGRRGRRKRRPKSESEEEDMNSEDNDNVDNKDEPIMKKVLPKRSTRSMQNKTETTDGSSKLNDSPAVVADAAATIGAISTAIAAADTDIAVATTAAAAAAVETLKTETKPAWSSADSDTIEDSPDSESESGGDTDKVKKEIKLSLPLPKLSIKKEEDLMDDRTELNSFEYTNASNFVSTELSVKSEDDNNIFNEKDKLLECLLNDDNKTGNMAATQLSTEQLLPTFDVVKVENLLDESEVVYVKSEEQMEDVLNCSDITNDLTGDCKIVLEDVLHRYPKLKEETSVKIARNAGVTLRSGRLRSISTITKKLPKKSDKPRRKYRKRGEIRPEDEARAPKRMAKISQSEVKERLKLIKKERSWQCPHCIKFYYIRKPFETHLRDVHKLSDAELKVIFKEEEVEKLDDEVFRCQICSKIYLIEKRLLAHIKLHGPDGSLIHKCPCYCALYFRNKEEAQEHARQNHKDLIYCDICDKYMTGHDGLKNHRVIYHNEVKLSDGVGGADGDCLSAQQRLRQRSQQRNLVCDKCGRKYSNRTSLTDHVRSDCGRLPIYACDICGKRLTTAGILKTHLLLHKDDTPYQCDQCGKTFKVKAQYKTHIKTRHTDYKPFKCHLCRKEYPYRESLLTHMTVHTGIKRFLCNGCGKRFTCISNLQAHRKVHAETCGLLPLNARATQYMGVQKGNLLLGAKPEAGLDYKETNTLIAREVIDRDLPMAQELNYPSEPCIATLPTQPLNYAQPTAAHFLSLPQLIMPQLIENSHHSY